MAGEWHCSKCGKVVNYRDDERRGLDVGVVLAILL